MCRSDQEEHAAMSSSPYKVRSRFEEPTRPVWGRHSPDQTAAPVTPVVPPVAESAQRCALPRKPFFFWEAVRGKATVAEAPCAAPAVDAWPKQHLLLPFPANRQDLHRDRGALPPRCGGRRGARGAVRARAVGCRSPRGPERAWLCPAHSTRGRGFRGPFVVAARVRGKRIVSLEPVGTIEAEGCIIAVAL